MTTSPPSRGALGTRVAIVLVAAPPVLLAAACLAFTVLGQFGRNPFWPLATVTVSEAAALRDRAAVAAFADAGVDLSARYAVRPELLDALDASAEQVTPVEAAILADRAEILSVLFRAGVAAPPDAVREWVCLARERRRGDALNFLVERFSPPDDLACPAS